MQRKRHLPACLAAAALAVFALTLGCSGSSSSSAAPAAPATGTVAMSVSDASTEDWAVIGVKLLGIALTPQGGGAPQTIMIAPAQAPLLNLVQLDNLSDVLGNAQVPVGTYTQATLTLSANPGDVVLTVANSPSASFLSDFTVTAGQTIPTADIQIKGATGVSPNLTTTVTVPLAKPLVVAAGQTGNLDVEFVLTHPAFIVGHVPATGDTIWTVNFNGTVRHNLVTAPEQMVLRHLYGTVTQAAAGALTVTRDFASLTGIATPTQQILQISPDAANGTSFYDLDAQTSTSITDFSSVAAALPGRYIRAAVRFQGGTLVAARMWVSSTFSNVWLSPEGHVSHVVLGGGSTDQIFVESETGAPVAVTINNQTQFYFRTPADPAADSAPVGAGTSFMTTHGLVRGFKVHVSCVDPTANPLVAASVDIETARFTGYLSAAGPSGFTDTRSYVTTADNYIAALAYIGPTVANGNDASGTPVSGFKWWNLTQPALADTSATAIADFAGTVTGSVNFGGTLGTIKVWGSSVAIPDPNLGSVWDARFTVLEPIRLPKGTVAPSSIAITGTGASFSMTVANGAGTSPAVVVDLTNAATLVYQIDLNLSTGVYSLAPVDLTTPAGVATFTANFSAKYPVVVYGVPQLGGTIMAYALYYTTTDAI